MKSIKLEDDQKLSSKNVEVIQQVKSKVTSILKEDIKTEEKITRLAVLIIEEQSETKNLLKQGFGGLALQNVELKSQLDKQILETEAVSKRLDQILKKQALADERKLKRRNRKRLPERQALTEDMYQFLIDRAHTKHRETYIGARLRLSLAILAVTGVRISELLPLKVHQLQTLFSNSWIAIDRIKRGPANHKAFLTRKGNRIIKERARDFEIITFLKSKDSYVFTAQNANKPLSRSAFNKIVNDFINESVKDLDNKPNIKSYSFRIGFITDLWRDTGDIEFVRQTIGHAKLDTTSKYVQNLSEEERQRLTTSLQSEEDLFYN